VRAEGVLAARQRRLTLVLEATHDPHNLSAVLRTCEAFGVQDVHLVPQADAPAAVNPGVSLGAERWLTVHRHADAASALAALRARDFRIFVSDLCPEATPLPAIPRDLRAAYVFGNEQGGVSPLWLENADARFVIPTAGFTGSLNLSVAAALTIYDRLLGRSAAVFSGDLTEAEKAALRAAWYSALAHGSRDLTGAFRPFVEDPPPPESIFPRDRRRR
jgi:tRNA (guanosine-2'-O-)-methyltransferase